MKIACQKKVKKGLPVSVDILNDADKEEIQRLEVFRDWLDGGKLVD